jgi:uncharacterized protein YkwD
MCYDKYFSGSGFANNLKNTFILYLSFFIVVCVLVTQESDAQESKVSFQKPDNVTIEKKLFARINSERKRRALPPLELSSDLTLLARNHSKHMAEIQDLTHLSSSGEIYLHRLVKEGGHFIKIGENVTFSETYQDEFIHQELMKSAELKENILDPEFDQVGVGVADREDWGYYITLDFRQSLKILELKDVEQKIKNEINEIRTDNRLSPLLFLDEAGVAARDYSMKKALYQPLPHIADEFGETLIHILITPHPDKIENLETKISGVIYGEAGVGIWFGKNAAYPGGAYFITLFLFPKSKYDEALDEDVAKMVLEEINDKRKAKELLPLKLDKRLSREAKKMSELMMSQDQEKATVPHQVRRKTFYNYILQNKTLTYISENPSVWPENVTEKIMEAYARRIGIGVSFKIDAKSRRETFWISLITRR